NAAFGSIAPAAVRRSKPTGVEPLGEGAQHDLADVLGQPLRIADRLQCAARMRLPLRIEFSPPVESARHARRDLRIESIECDHLLGEEAVARAVRGVEVRLIAAEAADQRIDLDRIAYVETRLS